MIRRPLLSLVHRPEDLFLSDKNLCPLFLPASLPSKFTWLSFEWRKQSKKKRKKRKKRGRRKERRRARKDIQTVLCPGTLTFFLPLSSDADEEELTLPLFSISFIRWLSLSFLQQSSPATAFILEVMLSLVLRFIQGLCPQIQLFLPLLDIRSSFDIEFFSFFNKEYYNGRKKRARNRQVIKVMRKRRQRRRKRGGKQGNGTFAFVSSSFPSFVTLFMSLGMND